jgi:ribosomal protein S18
VTELGRTEKRDVTELGRIEERDVTELGRIEERDVTELGRIEERDVTELGRTEKRDVTELGRIEERDVTELGRIEKRDVSVVPVARARGEGPRLLDHRGSEVPPSSRSQAPDSTGRDTLSRTFVTSALRRRQPSRLGTLVGRAITNDPPPLSSHTFTSLTHRHTIFAARVHRTLPPSLQAPNC